MIKKAGLQPAFFIITVKPIPGESPRSGKLLRKSRNRYTGRG
jgi:hypothetical protein